MKIQGKSLAEKIHDKFGYVAIGSDDNLFVNEKLPHMCNQGENFSISAEVMGKTTYEDYKKQAEWAGYGETCTDCFEGYFKVRLASE